jgi:hypothetical protein
MTKSIVILKRKLLNEDDEDDWSDQGEDERDDMDDEEEVKKAKVEHPFMRRARRVAAAHNVPLYHAMSLARQQDPQSYRHFKNSGGAKSKLKKAAPDDVALAWNSAVDALVASGLPRTDAMTHIRKVMPSLWARYRK